MGVIENFIEKYYANSWGLLSMFCFFSSIVIFVKLCEFVDCGENGRYIGNKLIYKVICGVILAGIGEILCLAGVKLEIEYVYFNVIFFIFVAGAVIVYGFLMCVMFRQILSPMAQIGRCIQLIIFLEVFLLAVTHHLEVLELVTGILGISGIEVLIIWLENEMREQKRKKGKEIKKGSDYPDSDLYPSRRKQLEKFMTILEQLEYEPYAIMVSGEWGSGKSSFVKRLEEELNQKSFIWIYAGSEKDVSEYMSEISSKIIDVMKKNNIYVEREDLIEKYFFAFSNLLDGTTLEPIKKITSSLVSSKGLDEREYLNSKLDDMDNTIYLIIDDLDRCDNEYQKKMFKVIRESMALHNCKTIFLVDKAKFLDKEFDNNYIEKYVSYTLDLCEVGYKEIVGYSIAAILDDNFIQEMDSVLSRGRTVEQIKEMIFCFPDELIERFELEKVKISDQKKNNSEKEEAEKRIREIEEVISNIKKDTTISRRVKNYLKGIKRDVEILNNGIGEISDELLKEDWFNAVLKVQFVKNFMPDLFNNIKISGDIYEFGRRNSDNLIDIIFELNYHYLIHNERRETVFNTIIYKIDIIKFSEVFTSNGGYLYELRNMGSVKHIDEYINCAENFDDLDKILQLYKNKISDRSHEIYAKQPFHNEVSQMNFITSIFKILSQRSGPFRTDGKEFLDFSKRFMDFFINQGLSSKEKTLFIDESYAVIRKVIIDNRKLLINVLSIFFSLSTIEANWHSLRNDDIDDLYEVLKKIDKGSKFKGLEDETNKILSIKTYFENLEAELEKEEYKIIKLDLEKMFSDIKNCFAICEYWDNIGHIINDGENVEGAITRSVREYFILKSDYTFREEIFSDVLKLAKALKVLEEFYKVKANEISIDQISLVLRLSRRIVLQYESDSNWFKDKKIEIVQLLNEITGLVCSSDETDAYVRDDIDKIKIYTYRFNKYCGDEEAIVTESI